MKIVPWLCVIGFLLFALPAAAQYAPVDARTDGAAYLASLEPPCADPASITRSPSYRQSVLNNFLSIPELAATERSFPGFASEAADITVAVIRQTLDRRKTEICAHYANLYRETLDRDTQTALLEFYQSAAGSKYVAGVTRHMSESLSRVSPAEVSRGVDGYVAGDMSSTIDRFNEAHRAADLASRSALDDEEREAVNRFGQGAAAANAAAAGRRNQARQEEYLQSLMASVVPEAQRAALPQLRTALARRMQR